MRPWLRERQPMIERENRVPQEIIERLAEADVFSLTTPRRYGGADLSTRELLDLYRTFASGDGSTAWLVWATAGGNLWSTAFPEEAVAPVYTEPWVGNRTFALGGTSRRMAGTARQVDGGWMIQGAWPFATGSEHASHGYLAVFYDETDDTKVGMALVPKSSLVQRHDWDAMGLAGTGSQTVATDGELFVPDAFFSTPAALGRRLDELHEQGLGPRRGGLARSVVTGTGLALGMADNALEVFLAGVGKRNIPYSPYSKQVEAPATHLTVGRAHSQVQAASLVAYTAAAELDQMDAEDREPSKSETLKLHADVAYIWDLCAGAVESLFRASGASAITKRQPLQLIARNCRAGSMHAANNVDTWMENLGRELCGVEAQASTMVLERR